MTTKLFEINDITGLSEPKSHGWIHECLVYILSFFHYFYGSIKFNAASKSSCKKFETSTAGSLGQFVFTTLFFY